MKKLYKVRVEFEYAVLAEDEMMAAHYADEAMSSVDASEFAFVTEADETPPDGWSKDTLVFGTHDEDVTYEDGLEFNK